MSSCYTCNLIGEVCPVCQDEKDAKLTNIAHDFVDEGNQQYKFQWLRDSEPVSGHEWVSPLIELKRCPDNIRKEFLEPVTNLEDRIDARELELGVGEKVCNDCNLAFNIRLSECPTCVEVNA